MSKRPSFQFYPADWRGDPDLRLCSLGARGLWIEMMCLMHDGEPYGHLTRLGRPLDPAALARLCGEAADDVIGWLGELDDNQVFSISEAGIMFSRRMVRDEGFRQMRAEHGHKGAEHGHKGAAHGRKGGRPKKAETPLPKNLRGVPKAPSKPSPSSSSSSPSPSSTPSEESSLPEGNLSDGWDAPAQKVAQGGGK